MITPIDSMRQGLTKAYLQIEQPRLPDAESLIPVHFNPTEYQLKSRIALQTSTFRIETSTDSIRPRLRRKADD